jgi:FO synthase
MEELILRIGRVPQQRDTLYRPVSEERRRTSFGAAPLTPMVMTPPRKRERAEAI